MSLRATSTGSQAEVESARAICLALRAAYGLASVEAPDEWEADRGAPVEGAPTMGLELEVPWSFYYPELWERFGLARGFSALSETERFELNEACSIQEVEVRSKLELSTKCGVPRGNDRYWEFAVDPCSDWRLPCAQIELLAAAGLLPLKGSGSLQITLGGLRQGREVQALARLLEALCGSAERIRGGIRAASKGPIHSGWARKGSGGVLEKRADELKLGAASACEIRALSVPNGVERLRDLLRVASVAGAAVAKAQEGKVDEEVRAWMAFQEGCESLLKEEGVEALDQPAESLPVEAWLRYAERFESIRFKTIEAWERCGLASSQAWKDRQRAAPRQKF